MGEVNMLNELLAKRNLPPLRSREEMVEILQREEYGYLPPRISYTVRTENAFVNFAANLSDPAPIIPRDIPFFISYSADTMFTKVEM